MDHEPLPSSLLSFPPLILVLILGNLTAKEVLVASEACAALHSFCNDNAVWKLVVKRKWGLKLRKCIVKPPLWRQYYKQKMTLSDAAFAWEPVKTTGEVISKRYQHTGSVVGKDVYIVGGQVQAEKRFDDIFVLHSDTQLVEKVVPRTGHPPKFARHTAVTIDDSIYFFGGYDGVSQHFHLSVFNAIERSWTDVRPYGRGPASRTNHSAVAMGARMYIFGGMYKDTTNGIDKLIFLNDMYMLDTSTSPITWTQIPQTGDVPSARCGHRMVSFGHMLVLFGGGCGEQWDRKFSDIYIFDTSTNVWTKPEVIGHAPVCTFTVTFTAGVFVFVFGGQSLTDNNLTNELYCFDTVSLSWMRIVPEGEKPGQRDMASGSIVGNSMYMFGGYCGAAIDNFHKLHIDPALVDVPVASASLPPNN